MSDSSEHFLDYDYSKVNSKLLHSYHNRRIASSFSVMFFNRDKPEVGKSSLQTTYSHIYFFLHSTTKQKINRYMGSVNLSPINILENSFETENDIAFDPSKLDLCCQEKEMMSTAIVKMLKKIQHLSNNNLIKNADSLITS